MRARADDGGTATKDQPRGGPAAVRRSRVWTWVLLLLSVVTAAAFALRRRRPALPVHVEQVRAPASRPVPSSSGAALPSPSETPAPTVTEPAPAETPVPPVTGAAPADDPAPPLPRVADEPDLPDEPAAATPLPSPAAARSPLAQLVRVSGLGRRSAEALVVAGITSLEELAASDPAALGAALDAAGVKRSATLATWPNQAARLLQA